MGENKVLIVSSGKSLERSFHCILNFNGPIGNVEEAIKLLEDRKRLYREWIENVVLIDGEKVLRNYSLASGDWKN